MYFFVLMASLFLIFLPGSIFSQPVSWEGQASVWGTFNDTDSINTQLAARYITGLNISRNLGNSITTDAQITANAFAKGRFNYNDRFRATQDVSDVGLHRCYARLAMANVDLRVGLQRLNFGSAVLLRPLMWFDGLDPRDPTQFSEGVYGALLRVFFNNNGNLWFWGLYENDEVKGWEILPTEKQRVEWGGRIQYPVYNGELAFTYHRRTVDISGLFQPDPPLPPGPRTEQRYAFDMRWDIEIGFWSEIVIVDFDNDELPLNRWRRFINMGADYTIGIGNGIGVMGEYFEIGEPSDPFGGANPARFLAASLDYSLGIADIVKGVFYNDLERNESYSFLAWIHTLDNWQFSLNGFWNPPSSSLNYDSGSMLAGKGVRLSITFNH